MITVTISINGQPIYTRTAVNKGERSNGLTCYDLDDGSFIKHRREDGAVALAKMMLDTIKEVKR